MLSAAPQLYTPRLELNPNKAAAKCVPVTSFSWCVTHLNLVFLQLDLTEDTVALVAAHGPQFLFVQGKQLGSGEDPQTVNGPAWRRRRNH